MKRFKNILVAVDLSDEDHLLAKKLSSPCEEAVQRAIQLAQENAASLTFMYTLNVSAQAETVMKKEYESQSGALADIDKTMDKLIQKAKEGNVKAKHIVTFGTSWIELIKQVLRGNHDLLIAGTRNNTRLVSSVIGSTGIKLLRKCPCAVWITKPHNEPSSNTILAAYDFSEVCDQVMELSLSLAELDKKTLRILHVLKNAVKLPAEKTSEIKQEIEKEISSRFDNFNSNLSPEILIDTGHAGDKILQHIQDHNIDVLMIGTIARTGIPGVIVGNTSEYLLPQIPCSILAIKPKDFESPITLD